MTVYCLFEIKVWICGLSERNSRPNFVKCNLFFLQIAVETLFFFILWYVWATPSVSLALKNPKGGRVRVGTSFVFNNYWRILSFLDTAIFQWYFRHNFPVRSYCFVCTAAIRSFQGKETAVLHNHKFKFWMVKHDTFIIKACSQNSSLRFIISTGFFMTSCLVISTQPLVILCDMQQSDPNLSIQ